MNSSYSFEAVKAASHAATVPRPSSSSSKPRRHIPTAAASTATRADKTAPSPPAPVQRRPAARGQALRQVTSYLEIVLPGVSEVWEQWQPADVLPEPSSPDFLQEVVTLREQATNIHKELWVALVGSYIAEALLPNRLALLNSCPLLRDETGAAQHAWARWQRAEVAQVNRHRSLLRHYLYLSGAVDMAAVERTVQYSIGKGVDSSGLEGDPYQLMMQLAVQECLSRLMYTNLSRLAAYYGGGTLSNVCGAIAEDKAKSSRIYCELVKLLVQADGEGAVVAMGRVMQRGVVLLQGQMLDGWHAAANRRVPSSNSSKMRLSAKGESSSSSRQPAASSRVGGRDKPEAVTAGLANPVLAAAARNIFRSRSARVAGSRDTAAAGAAGTAPSSRYNITLPAGVGGLHNIPPSSSSSSIRRAPAPSSSAAGGPAAASGSGLPAAEQQEQGPTQRAAAAGPSTHTITDAAADAAAAGPTAPGPAASATNVSTGSAAGGQGQPSPSRPSPLHCDYLAVADGAGVYSPNDYAAILDYLLDLWQVRALQLSTPAAAAARELLVAQPPTLRQLAELQLEQRLMERRAGRATPISFSWLHGRDVPL